MLAGGHALLGSYPPGVVGSVMRREQCEHKCPRGCVMSPCCAERGFFEAVSGEVMPLSTDARFLLAEPPAAEECPPFGIGHKLV